MMCDGKMQCAECPLLSSCPSDTKVFVNYCGSMNMPFKDQINHARVDCRVRRRFFKYHGNALSAALVTNAFIFPQESKKQKVSIMPEQLYII